MKRRPKPEDESRTPLEVRRFDAEVWGSGLEAWGRWWDARAGWEAETGLLPDMDIDPRLPVPDAPVDPTTLWGAVCEPAPADR